MDLNVMKPGKEVINLLLSKQVPFVKNDQQTTTEEKRKSSGTVTVKKETEPVQPPTQGYLKCKRFDLL